jgi:hypothetical protein
MADKAPWPKRFRYPATKPPDAILQNLPAQVEVKVAGSVDNLLTMLKHNTGDRPRHHHEAEQS